MYFWNIRNIKEEIREEKLSEKDKFIYLFIYLVLSYTTSEVMSIWPLEIRNLWDNIFSISSLAICLLGTLYAFRANGGSSGKDFLGKYFSIGFVVGIRFLVISIPLFIAIVVYNIMVFPDAEEPPSTFYSTIPLIVLVLAYYWRLIHHIRDIKNS